MIKLICMDMDGVLAQPRNFWMELHRAYGTFEEGQELTKQYLHVDYDRLVKEVVGRLWKDKDGAVYFQLIKDTPLMSGIQGFFAQLDVFRDINGERVPRAIVSSGPFELAERIKEKFTLDFIFANRLLMKNGKVSGEFQWPIGAGTDPKRKVIEQLCDDLEILPQNVLMIGGSKADLEAFRIAGVSIAFNCKDKELRDAATYIVDSTDLTDVVPILEQLR